MSQSQDLHRALLRPAIIHTLRAAGFHSTKPSVLDTLVNIAERHLQLLATTTAAHASASHNDPIPTITDVRMALTDCGCLTPYSAPAEEGWRERLRAPLTAVADVPQGGRQRQQAEKRKRADEDVRDVREFAAWFTDGPAWREIKRVAGMAPDHLSGTGGGGAVVGVGGGVVQADDFLAALKRKYGKGGDSESRWLGTVLGSTAVDDRDLAVEGGPDLREWRPRPLNGLVGGTNGEEEAGGRSDGTGT